MHTTSMELEVHLFHARVTAVLVLLVSILRNSSCSICQGHIPEAEAPCETGGIDISVEKIIAGSLEVVNRSYPCTLITRYGTVVHVVSGFEWQFGDPHISLGGPIVYPGNCGLIYNAIDIPYIPPSKNSSEAFTELKATQCLAEGTPLYLGLNFSWTMNKTDENVTGLSIVVWYEDYQPFLHTLYMNLTQYLNIGEVIKFSTNCVPFEGIQNGRSFTVFAKDNNQGDLVGPRVNIVIDCDEVPKKFSAFCPGMPEQRPVATVNCNKTVSVTFTPEAPPGIGDRTEYSVEICFYREDTQLTCKRPTLRATLGKPHSPRVYFDNVTAGTYNATFAFLDDSGLLCGDHRYKGNSNFTVKDCKEPLLQVAGITLGAFLICGLSAFVVCILIRHQHGKGTSHPDEFDSVSGMIIIGAECPPGSDNRMDEVPSCDGRGHSEMSHRLLFQAQKYPSGLPPSSDELVSIHDGRSRVISI